MKIYLAGPIFDCDDSECVAWRDLARAHLGEFELYDPMVRDYRGRTTENVQAIVEEDKADIDTCDLLLVNMVKPSAGTSMEIIYAWERKKPVYVVYPDEEVSPWILYHASKVFQTLDEAMTFIKNKHKTP